MEQQFLKQTMQREKQQYEDKIEQLNQKLIGRDAKYQKKSKQFSELKQHFEAGLKNVIDAQQRTETEFKDEYEYIKDLYKKVLN